MNNALWKLFVKTKVHPLFLEYIGATTVPELKVKIVLFNVCDENSPQLNSTVATKVSFDSPFI
jgi:hypothetical protein